MNGAKHTKKDVLAMRLASKSGVVFVKPYTDKKIPINCEPSEADDFIHLNETQLSRKIDNEIPLVISYINNSRYVIFENQLKADCVVLILDDAGVFNLKQNWGGEIITVKLHSKNEKPSNRNLMTDDEFDYVFDVDSDDFDKIVGELWQK